MKKSNILLVVATLIFGASGLTWFFFSNRAADQLAEQTRSGGLRGEVAPPLEDFHASPTVESRSASSRALEDRPDVTIISKTLNVTQAGRFFQDHIGISLPPTVDKNSNDSIHQFQTNALSAFLKDLDLRINPDDAAKWNEVSRSVLKVDRQGDGGTVWKKGSVFYRLSPKVPGSPDPAYGFFFDPSDGNALFRWSSHWEY